jgi:uncharacterized membrane protein YedE/YeeE
MALLSDPPAVISWQVPYIAGAVLGGYITNLEATHKDIDIHIQGVGPIEAFIGGLLMIMGSRMGGGCTSGHGLSGMAILQVHSTVGVCAMFAGGIIVSFIAQFGIMRGPGSFYIQPRHNYIGC